MAENQSSLLLKKQLNGELSAPSDCGLRCDQEKAACFCCSSSRALTHFFVGQLRRSAAQASTMLAQLTFCSLQIAFCRFHLQISRSIQSKAFPPALQMMTTFTFGKCSSSDRRTRSSKSIPPLSFQVALISRNQFSFSQSINPFSHTLASNALVVSINSEGGFFKCHLNFPKDYPHRPPKMKFMTEIWHPNGKCRAFILSGFLPCCILLLRNHAKKTKHVLLYLHDDSQQFVHAVRTVDKNGNVCISILHEPGDDKYGYEKASERWLPVHTVETILISVISLLADPNDESPANVDAAVSGPRRLILCNC